MKKAGDAPRAAGPPGDEKPSPNLRVRDLERPHSLHHQGPQPPQAPQFMDADSLA
jgi:hypothetical protein